jgi:UDP-N-acetylmuramoyl-tripeptide--D-alanyl-D-alanine ligase
MIIGFVGNASSALLNYIAATIGTDSALVVAIRDVDGVWKPDPDVIVVRDLDLLFDEPPVPLAPQGAHVVVVDGTHPSSMACLGGLDVVTVSLVLGSDFSSAELDYSRKGTRFDVHSGGEVSEATIGGLGERRVIDALIALAVADARGVSMPDAIVRLANVVGNGEDNSWDLHLQSRVDGVTIINDASEADPHTMATALKILTLMTYGSTRAVAVLGELTVDEADSQHEHDRIGRLVVRLNVGKLIVVGSNARHIHNAAGLEGSWDGESVLVASIEEAYDLLDKELRDGDVVLVKSSKVAGLGFLGDRLEGKTA